jgi:hypothetical protein
MLTYGDMQRTWPVLYTPDFEQSACSGYHNFHAGLLRMLTYADVCSRMLTYAGVFRRMLTYTDVC